MANDVVKRDADGKFLPGGPGGPGRKPGLSHSEKVRILLEPHRDELIGRALELTKNADPFAAANALRICLERLAPAPRAEGEKVFVPGLAEATTWKDKCETIVAAVARGEISAESAERLLRMVDIYRRATEIDDIDRRLSALERGREEPHEAAPPGDGSDLA
jgi:hypothetical protein